MYRIFLLGILLISGCQNVVGPFSRRDNQRVDDPLLTIGEQQKKDRSRLALQESSSNVAPPTNVDRPGPHGR
ncbi:MAG TPA: hypothetical protein VGY77_04870 [Gemmataceae bacterium]|jgi:hypothetical protein|nr:hypothetical protein [Gemmataceae bacterium]